VRIVLADPAILAAKVLAFALNVGGHDVLLAGTAAEALDTVQSSDVEAVILDTDLPDMSAVDLCAALRSRRFPGPILILSDVSETRAKLHAFDLGADDYVVRPCDPVEVAARVVVMARRRARTDARLQDVVLTVDEAVLSLSASTIRLPGRPPSALTPTEMRMLAALMRSSPAALRREALVEQVWGNRFDGDSNRVEVYIMRLRRKLERDPARPDHLQTIRGLGYAFRPRIESTVSEPDQGEIRAAG